MGGACQENVIHVLKNSALGESLPNGLQDMGQLHFEQGGTIFKPLG